MCSSDLSPIVVFADADFEKAVAAVISGFTHNAGQCCIATSRLLVEQTVAEDFKALLYSRLAMKTLVQPVATSSQFEKVKGYIEQGKMAGKLLFEGEYPIESEGFFVAPAVFEYNDPEFMLACEEIFGPVLVMRTFENEEEAVSFANETEYGLAASVWSLDLNKASRVARRIRAGRLWINSQQDNFPELPVGGYNASGIGREAGIQGILAYSELKTVIIDTRN